VTANERPSYRRGRPIIRPLGPARTLVICTSLLAAAGASAAPEQGGPAPKAPPVKAVESRAEAARASGRLSEAAALYREALAARPRWAEGLWALGTIAYERDDFAECRGSFTRLVAIQPGMSAAWALRGLCEFRLGDRVSARRSVEKGLSLGMPPGEELTRAVLYHQALLLVRDAQFDLAIAPLRSILQFQGPTPELELACGLVLLRRPLLPQAVPEAAVPLVREAGQAYCAHLARHPEVAAPRFEALIAKHPRERYLHYGYGLVLAQRGSAEAIEQYRREIGLFPDDVLARVELGFALLAQGRMDEAVPPAEEATRLAPGLFVTHLVLGRALAATGRVDQGVRELEEAARLAPRIAEIQLALARAYAQAGRKAEADRARAEFQSLEASRRGASEPSGPAPERP
jgi:tetratricopeptide (TPR) repeat protein